MINSGKKYKRVFSVGCFDQFHYGHKKILEKMREYGDELIIGIHDDESIEKLKKLPPSAHKKLIDRMADLKPFCDRIFIINSVDPTNALRGIVSALDTVANSVFIRGVDNQTFPGRKFIEKHIDIIFLPYTESISATKIRKELGLV